MGCLTSFKNSTLPPIPLMIFKWKRNNNIILEFAQKNKKMIQTKNYKQY